MKLDIKPYKSIGPIVLGESSSDIRALFGGKFISDYRGGEDEKERYDFFKKEGVFVAYDAMNKVAAVEIVAPGNVFLNGVNLSKLTYCELKALLKKNDPNLEIDPDGLTSYALGIGAWIADPSDIPESPATTIIVFRKNYYN